MAAYGEEDNDIKKYPTPGESYGLLEFPTPSVKEEPPALDDIPPTKTLFGRRFPRNPGRRRVRRFNPRIYIPILVLVVQSVILMFGWIFFYVTVSKPRPLPPNMAVYARDHPQAMMMIVTVIATVISSISSFLYTRSIRYALARILVKPVTFYTVTSAIKVSTQSPVFNVAHLEWTIGALVCAFAVNGQTAGWSTLLTPQVMDMEAPMTGFELNILSSDFQNMMVTNRDVVTPDLFTNVIPLVQASGSTAVSSHFSLPSILNFNQLSYINSTNGILPANYQQWFSTMMSSAGTTMPANTQVNIKNSPPGFPTSYSMTQQGFTSSVSCSQRQLDASTSPSLQILKASSTILNATTITLAQMVVQCTGVSTPIFSAPVITSSAVDAVFGLACPVNQSDGTQKWELILTGSGVYSFINTTVCLVSPQVTTISIDYNDATKLFNSSFPSFVNGSEPWGAVNAPWVGEYTTSIFLRGLNVGQRATGNSVGDTISSFVSNIPPYPELLNDVLEQYIRGVMEFSVTLLRTAYTQDGNNLFPGKSSIIPPSMRVATNGTYRTQTIGWFQSRDAAPSALLAPTIVSIISIIIVVTTLVKMKNNPPEPVRNHYFDPGNILHVISAASAGGVREPLPPFNEDPVEYTQRVRVTLGAIDGDPNRVGFLQVR